MKNSLGRILFLLFSPFLLLADSNLAGYTLNINKHDVVEKEAVQISFTAIQKDHSNVMFFAFEPKKSADYSVILLTQNTKKTSVHDNSTTFTYLLFPLKSGDITVDFDFTVKVATDQALAEVYTGTRDTAKQEKTSNTPVKIDPLHLHVSPLNQNVQLVGDFTLDSKLQKNEINKYGAANISYTLNGVGYQDISLQPLREIKGVTIFSQKNDLKNEAQTDGYNLKREYSYALSSNKNFQIPPIELTAYSPKLKKYYSLKAPGYEIKVNTIDPNTLLDKKNSPLSKSLDYSWLKELFIAFVIFMAGFVSAKIMPTISFKRERKKRFEDIKKTSSAKELILVLMQNYQSYDLKEFINKLEMMEYKKSDSSFKEIKADLLKKLM